MSKFISTKKMDSRTGYRCQGICPSADNHRKEMVKDYKSRALIFDNRADAVRVATAMLALADTEQMEDENTKLHVTALTERHNEDGYSVTVLLDPPQVNDLDD